MATSPRPPAPAGGPRESAALVLTLLFAGLIVYASLYPFTDWTWPAGQPPAALLALSWPRWHVSFDDWSNFVGYMPLGALVFASGLRAHRGTLLAGVLATLLPAALSWTMEVLQHFLPGRVSSLMDWVLNSLGAATGAALAIAAHAAGGGVRWGALRERWFAPGSGSLVALLVVWPLGFLFPTTVPFGQGVSWERLQEAAFDALSDHPLAPWFEWIWASLGDSPAAMSRAAEGLVATLGLFGPVMVAFSITRRGWRRVAMVAVACGAGLAANTLSAALNFGPVHAFAWLTPSVPIGLVCGAALALACLPSGPHAAAALGLVALSVQVVLVAQAPSDPYYAESLQAWEQGRFIRFHGLAQWVGWLWPFAALVALFARLIRAEPARQP